MSSRNGLGENKQPGSLWWRDAVRQLSFHRTLHALPREGEAVTQQHLNALPPLSQGTRFLKMG